MKYLYFDGQTTRIIFYFIIHSTFRRWQPYNSSVCGDGGGNVSYHLPNEGRFAAIPFMLFRWADRTSTARTKNDLLADCIFLLFLYSLYVSSIRENFTLGVQYSRVFQTIFIFRVWIGVRKSRVVADPLAQTQVVHVETPMADIYGGSVSDSPIFKTFVNILFDVAFALDMWMGGGGGNQGVSLVRISVRTTSVIWLLLFR